MQSSSSSSEVSFMDKQLYQATVDGNTNFLTIDEQTEENNNFFLKKTCINNNIIHIAVHHQRFEFIKAAVKRFPQLVSEANVDGDNPLHVAAKTGNLEVVELLVSSCKVSLQVGSKPWMARNNEGNTPLHVALIYGKNKVALHLLDKVDDADQLVHICNQLDETPLHLAVKHRIIVDPEAIGKAMNLISNELGTRFRETRSCREEDSIKVIRSLLDQQPSIACWRDKERLTPLLRAATLNPSYLLAIEAIVEDCPQSVELRDHCGRTFLHLINKLSTNVDFEKLFKSRPELESLKNDQDNMGNTPAHIALCNGNTDLFLILLKARINLNIRNKDDVSVVDLIRQQSQQFWEDCKAKVGKMRHPDDLLVPQLLKDEMDAIKTMDITFLEESIKELGRSFFNKKSNHQNILHIAYKSKLNNQGFKDSELEFIKLILENLPSLMCQVDFWGKNPLHYIVEKAPRTINRQFLNMVKEYYQKIKEQATTIEELCYEAPWRAKDKDGNTPLHLALQSYGFDYISCAREILAFDVGLAVEVNQWNETPLHILCKSCSDELVEDMDANLEHLKFILRNRGKIDAATMTDMDGYIPLLRAAKARNLLFLHQISLINHTINENATDRSGNTLWHLLADMEVQDNHYTNVHEILTKKLQSVMKIGLTKKNNDGNTPLHLAIKNNNFKVATIFNEAICTCETLQGDDVFINKRDIDGNTPLHLLVGRSGEPYANKFFQSVMENKCYNLETITSMRDNNNNTFFHQAILKGDIELAKSFIQLAKENSFGLETITKIRNNDGNTVFHLAILEHHIELAKCFIEHAKETSFQLENIAKVPNNNGNTIFHLAILKHHIELADSFIENAKETSFQLDSIARIRNNEGYTPLHLSIMNKHFEFARSLIECAATKGCLNKLMQIPDNQGESPSDLIDSIRYLPKKFDEFFWRKPKVVAGMLGVWSSSGISTEMNKEYTNTIGVTAALLATITFTAAFSVPGGLNNDNGSPLLMKKAAFQVFIVSDIFAMCLSMMVLFCLLWIMTISNKKGQAMLLDVTIFLLEIAFYATLLTFMTGLYVTVFPVTSWIAILACVLCSLLILFMRKGLITRLIPCIINVYAWFRNGCPPLCTCCTIKENDQENRRNIDQPNNQAEEQTSLEEQIHFDLEDQNLDAEGYGGVEIPSIDAK